MKCIRSFLPFFGMVAATTVGVAGQADEDHRYSMWQENSANSLFYSKPAAQWTEALPIGNGHLGAMIYGKTDREIVQFNEDTVWTGQPVDYQRPGAAEVLPELRDMLFEGRQEEAEHLAGVRFMSLPLRQNAYQPLGDLLLHFDHDGLVSDYRRRLDLDTAIVSVDYKVDGVEFQREIYASYPDKVIVLRLSADKAGRLTFKAGFDSPHEGFQQRTIDDTTLGLAGRVTHRSRAGTESRLRFESLLAVEHEGGRVRVTNEGIEVEDATSVLLRLTAATNYVDYENISGDPHAKCLDILEATASASYSTLKSRHVADYQELFHRVHFSLGETDPGLTALDTDERLARFQETNDTGLLALLFQYGRYLLIASSRPGSQAANLQGVWNAELSPSWDSKYTTNINLEMNYWPAEMTNLSECHAPLIDLIEDCSKSGALTAEIYYNAPGWVLHHNTDVWRGTAPINASNHGIWPTGGAWLCQHLWWHYSYTLDEDFLRKRAYPIMKSAAEFFVKYLVEDPRSDVGWLISGPSNSPENGGLVMGPAMDHQIIRNLFSNCIEAARVLNIDEQFAARLEAIRARIAPNQIGRHGQLQEWLEDKDDPTNKHRHVSHLWGLHPGSEITRESTPELYAAARKSLEFRGDLGTGWSMGWKVNFWARLHDGDHAYLILRNLMRLKGSSETQQRGGGLYANLFDAHPPFQIDGNFGATSGIAEMLMQSHAGFIELLPALPAAWKRGEIRGLKARGAFEVDIKWSDGKLVNTTIRNALGGTCRLRYQGKTVDLVLKPGESRQLNLGAFL